MRKLYSSMLIALVCGGLFCAGAAVADDVVTKVITLKHANMAQVVHTLGPLLPGSSVLMSNDNDHVVLRGPKDIVAGLEAIINQLDVAPAPKRDVETTVYMVVATSQAANAGAMPAELDPVIKQLKGVFNYKGFRLLDSFVLRSRDLERGNTTGFVPPLPDSNIPAGHKISYTFRYNRVTIDGSETAPMIRFDGLTLGMKVPVSGGQGQVTFMDASIGTDVDVPEGKKVVVGKTSAVEGPDSALILVISAKVVN